jgi:hypothetical protein
LLFIGSRKRKDNFVIIQIAVVFTQINSVYKIDINDMTVVDSEKIKRQQFFKILHGLKS